MINLTANELSRILIVDDEKAIRSVLSDMLSSEGYSNTTAQSAEDALKELDQDEYSVVIADINMPGTNGIELLEAIIKRDEEIAVIMLTGVQELNTAVYCLKLGAYDYLTKPINTTGLLVSVSRALERRSFLIREKHYTETLEKEVKKKTRALELTQKEIIYRLAIAAEHRDEDTWEHLFRIAASSHILSQRLGLPRKFCEMVHTVSPLHDIGKIGIPDSVLLKPARLTHDEYELMKRHSLIGENILNNSESELIQTACEIALSHHEWYDGRGYPHGIKGEDIPLAARIVAVADVFDALTSKRPYKEAWSVEKAVELISEERETHFDPDVVDAFVQDIDEISALRWQSENVVDEKLIFA
ncbi:MAG: HD domain-containing phosphohydrolase [bacterium]